MDKEELIETNPQVEQAQEQPVEQEAPRGRAAVLDQWRGANPDFEGDPEDDDLYDYALSNANDYRGRYEKQNEVNSALAGRISEDPRLGALIAGIMETDKNGKRRNPAYVIAKLYGKDFLEDEEAMGALEEGYAEYLEGAKENQSGK